MFPYVLIIAIPLFFLFVSVERRKGVSGLVVSLGASEKTRSSNLAIPVFFIALFIVLAVRDKTVGIDVINYEFIFKQHASRGVDWHTVFSPEGLYWAFNWIVGRFTRNFQWYLAICAALTIFPIAKIYNEDRNHSYLKIILFVNMVTFIFLFSGIRQALAMAVGMIAYKYVREKKITRFLICCVVALGIHHSGFMLIPMYFLYHASLKKKHLFIAVPVIVAVFIFKRQIFSIFGSFLLAFSDKYDRAIETTGAYMSLVLFIVFAIFSYVILDETKIDEETTGLRNFLLFSVVLQIFALLGETAMRLNYYYILFIPILIPKVIQNAKPRYKGIAQIGLYVMCAFFTIYFFAGIREALITGESTLKTVPYIPFWRG